MKVPDLKKHLKENKNQKAFLKTRSEVSSVCHMRAYVICGHMSYAKRIDIVRRDVAYELGHSLPATILKRAAVGNELWKRNVEPN